MIAWFARNGVAANLLMVFIVAWGLFTMTRLPLEVFPSFELDVVNVRMSFRGATPAEVEQGVTIKIEEAVHDLEGIKRLSSTAFEGRGTVRIEASKGYDVDKLLDQVKQRVDGVNTFPGETERPSIYIPSRQREVISVMVTGSGINGGANTLSERELRGLGERVRDELAALPEVSLVKLDAVRDYEIAIEVSEQALRRHRLTLAEVAAAIERSSMDLSAGAIKTDGGEVLISTKGQAYNRADFADLAVMTRGDGTRLTVGDLAIVKDGFNEDPVKALCNGQPCVLVDVFRRGNQSAIRVASAVKNYVEKSRAALPPGVDLALWRDRSKVVKARLDTLTRSALQGGALVIILLTLFLRPSVAFWVFIGVPVSFMGGIAMMAPLGMTINIVSLFGFILVLGIVVDDAIVTGENIYTHLRKNPDPLAAAIRGTEEVAVPVTFGVLTTVAAFLPMLFIEGVRGQIFSQIPMIVVPVLLFSLIESKLVLPSHLSHVRVYQGGGGKRRNALGRVQGAIADGLELFIIKLYRPLLAAALRQRYLTLALFIGIAVVVFSLASSGHIRFVFFPRVQSEVASANLVMPAGTPFEVTSRHVERMTAAAQTLQQKYRDPDGDSVIRAVLSTSGADKQSHRGRVRFEIASPEARTLTVTSSELVREWRRMIGPVPGAKELTYRAEIGRGGSPLDVQLNGNDFGPLRALAGEVKAKLLEYPGVFDAGDSFDDGKEEIQLTIKPEAQQLGLTLADLARQVRQAFFGAEVQRVQRGREDVRVMVRYPLDERRSLNSLESMLIRAPDGAAVPFREVAEARIGRSFAAIKRIDRSRTINITADVNKEQANVEAIKADLATFLDGRAAAYPGVSHSLEGEAREQRESFGSLKYGLIFALLVIYTLLAIPFRSYLQPLMVMSVIPFGICGAIVGHMIMGMPLSIISVCGMLALIGVVINDSLVLVDYVNRRRRADPVAAVYDAVLTAGTARFRPVLLTSLTTFAGLTPLILEKSTQAQFLIPMAVSLGFGILFATFITLLLIPVNYMVSADLARGCRSLVGLYRRTPNPEPRSQPEMRS